MSDASFNVMLERLRKLPELGTQAAPSVANAVRGQLERSIASGSTPDGKAWEKTKDGKQPLATAAKALAVVAVGATVFARLTGHIARHHLGRARGGVVRQILPTEEIPSEMAKAIKAVLVEEFKDVMGGG
jgi:hypothetical protein